MIENTLIKNELDFHGFHLFYFGHLDTNAHLPSDHEKQFLPGIFTLAIKWLMLTNATLE
jgi:hypothetical protein